MDIKKLTKILLGVGCLVTVAAFIWWAHFYGQVTTQMGGNLGNAFGCLYSSGGPCGFVSGVAQSLGVIPYTPVVFWIGAVMLGVGIILRLSLKTESTDSPSLRDMASEVGLILNLPSKKESAPLEQGMAVVPQKSLGVGLLLVGLFGPLGMFYSTITGAIVMLIAVPVLVRGLDIMGMPPSLRIYGLVYTWLIILLACAIWAAISIIRHNQKLRASKVRY